MIREQFIWDLFCNPRMHNSIIHVPGGPAGAAGRPGVAFCTTNHRTCMLFPFAHILQPASARRNPIQSGPWPAGFQGDARAPEGRRGAAAAPAGGSPAHKPIHARGAGVARDAAREESVVSISSCQGNRLEGADQFPEMQDHGQVLVRIVPEADKGRGPHMRRRLCSRQPGLRRLEEPPSPGSRHGRV